MKRMKLEEIKKLAQGIGIRTFGSKKKDLIRAIQKAENNIECYGTKRMEHCQEKACLWKRDCIAFNNNRRLLPNLDESFISKNRSARSISMIGHVFLSQT